MYRRLVVFDRYTCAKLLPYYYNIICTIRVLYVCIYVFCNAIASFAIFVYIIYSVYRACQFVYDSK